MRVPMYTWEQDEPGGSPWMTDDFEPGQPSIGRGSHGESFSQPKGSGMTIKSATPYFILDGRVEQAIALYQRALDAKVETLQRFGDVDQSCSAAMKSRVMHAELRVGDARLMMSDGPNEGGPPQGGNVSVALYFDDPAQARRSFDALATNGKVIEPLFDAPWGDLFGVVSDEFGIPWMFTSARVKKA
jgi:PhnB protein